MTLWSQTLPPSPRPVDKWMHYFPIYERHLGRFINQSVTIMEIGCGEGGSLEMWKRYLGPLARVVGLDIRPECAAFADRQIDVRIGDQKDPSFLQAVVRELGAPDIVIDDGSHMMADISGSFRHLYPLLPKNGVYIVEDLHTAYWGAYGGGVGRPESFIEQCKGYIDELNAHWTGGAVPPTWVTELTRSLSFYDSVVVLERGVFPRRLPPYLEVPPTQP